MSTATLSLSLNFYMIWKMSLQRYSDWTYWTICGISRSLPNSQTVKYQFSLIATSNMFNIFEVFCLLCTFQNMLLFCRCLVWSVTTKILSLFHSLKVAIIFLCSDRQMSKFQVKLGAYFMWIQQSYNTQAHTLVIHC